MLKEAASQYTPRSVIKPLLGVFIVFRFFVLIKKSLFGVFFQRPSFLRYLIVFVIHSVFWKLVCCYFS